MEQVDIETTFSFLASRARVRDAINALLAVRELEWVNVGQQTMLQPKTTRQPAPPAAGRKTAIHLRLQGRRH